jgi:hypothetical protein
MIMRTLGAIVVLMACALPAFGQAPAQNQSRDDLQPGVNTSATPPEPATRTETRSTAPPAPAPAPAKPAASSAPAAASIKSTHPGKALDRLELDTTDITGNKELPKVMYVVPWKHSDLGDLTGKPANSLVDEVLQPVDRDVFNREERYYHTVAPQKGGPGSAPEAPAH